MLDPRDVARARRRIAIADRILGAVILLAVMIYIMWFYE